MEKRKERLFIDQKKTDKYKTTYLSSASFFPSKSLLKF